MLLRNSSRSPGVIGLDAMSSQAKRTLSFRPFMSRTSFSRSVDIRVTGRVCLYEIANAVAPAIVGGWGIGWMVRGLAQPFAARLLDNPPEPVAVPKCECGLRIAIKSGPRLQGPQDLVSERR
jgi:hypothetical protein